MRNDSNTSIILLTVGLISFSVLVAGCTRSPGSSPQNAAGGQIDTKGVPQVPTVEVVAKDLAQKIEMSASVESFESVDLYARIGGYLESISVDIGDGEPDRQGADLSGHSHEGGQAARRR